MSAFYPGAMATGENLFSHQDARNLLRYGGMRPDRDWLQFDCALSYGLVEYLRTLEVLHQFGWSLSRCIPHGGHQMSLMIAAGLGLGGNESYPDLFQPYGGFPDGVRVENGRVTMPEIPGIGFEGKSDLIKVMHELSGSPQNGERRSYLASFAVTFFDIFGTKRLLQVRRRLFHGELRTGLDGRCCARAVIVLLE